MAKKSKAKKRKQAQKRTQTRKVTTSKPAKARKQPAVVPEITEEEIESRKLDAMMNEAAPRQPLQQKGIIAGLIVVLVVLGIVLAIMYQKTNDLRQNTANTGQDQLLNVHQSDQNSLQPTAPQDGSSNPQSTSNPQNSSGSANANQLQPQQSPTPAQLNQMQ